MPSEADMQAFADALLKEARHSIAVDFANADGSGGAPEMVAYYEAMLQLRCDEVLSHYGVGHD